MADYCRTEVAGDVISGQRASGLKVVPLTKFGDPSSNRLATIQNKCFILSFAGYIIYLEYLFNIFYIFFFLSCLQLIRYVFNKCGRLLACF